MKEFDVKDLISKDKKTVQKGDLKELNKDRSKSGRPALPKSEKKTKKIMAYFTEAELMEIQAYIEDSGVSLSNFVRMNTLRAIKGEK